MQHTFWMCCPCHFGLEHTLHFELKKLGAEQIQVQDGRILFRGDYHLLAMANLCLSTAERVLVQLGSFPAYNFEELFQGMKKLPLEEIADEMLAILSDRNRIMQKHEMEETNARWNEFLNSKRI